MSASHAAASTARTPRVRDQARGVLALMAFSALASGGLAGALLLLTSLGR